MAASTCRKCKLVFLSLENKLSILDRLAKGEKATELASEFWYRQFYIDCSKEEGVENSIIRLVDGIFLYVQKNINNMPC